MATKKIAAKLSIPKGIVAAMEVDAEVSANVTASINKILPVNSTTGARTITPPTTTQNGAWFGVVDSRNRFDTQNCIVNFSADNKLQTSSSPLTLSVEGQCAIFVWSGVPAAGWLRIV